MGMVMMPSAPADEIEANARLPEDTIRKRAMEVASEITRQTRQMFEKHNLQDSAEGIKTNIWGTTVDIEIVMNPPGERARSVEEVTELWRQSVSDIPGVDQITFESESGPGSWRDDITVDLSHSNIDVLERASQEFVRRLEEYNSSRDVNDSYEPGKAQLDFKLRPEGRFLGLTPAYVGQQLRGSFYGINAIRQLRGTNEVEVRVKLPEEERSSLNAVEQLIIRTADGREVPLMDVADVKRGRAFNSIDRRNGRRIISVGTDVEPKSEIGQVMTSLRNETLPQLRADFPGLTWTFEGSQAEMRESTNVLFGGFMMAMFVIYALLAIAFKSYFQPVIVMFAIPFGIVGAVLGHILLGFNLSLISMMGIVALSGVVVNDSLIMVDYANRQRQQGSLPYQAITDAGVRRFRPILLTTLTTFGGLTPIILETSRQAVFLIPMAISLGFGILFATSIILLMVPCFYMSVEDVRGFLI